MAQPLETDALDLLLDDQNDLVIEDGDFVFARGITGVMQLCRIAMLMVAGEWFLDLDAGVPYWDKILGFKPALAKNAARLAINSELLGVPGVISVTKLEIEYVGANRSLEITWQVKTALGETPADSLVLATRRSGVA